MELKTQLEKQTLPILREICRERDLKVGGRKNEVIERILADGWIGLEAEEDTGTLKNTMGTPKDTTGTPKDTTGTLKDVARHDARILTRSKVATRSRAANNEVETSTDDSAATKGKGKASTRKKMRAADDANNVQAPLVNNQENKTVIVKNPVAKGKASKTATKGKKTIAVDDANNVQAPVVDNQEDEIVIIERPVAKGKLSSSRAMKGKETVAVVDVNNEENETSSNRIAAPKGKGKASSKTATKGKKTSAIVDDHASANVNVEDDDATRPRVTSATIANATFSKPEGVPDSQRKMGRKALKAAMKGSLQSESKDLFSLDVLAQKEKKKAVSTGGKKRKQSNEGQLKKPKNARASSRAQNIPSSLAPQPFPSVSVTMIPFNSSQTVPHFSLLPPNINFTQLRPIQFASTSTPISVIGNNKRVPTTPRNGGGARFKLLEDLFDEYDIGFGANEVSAIDSDLENSASWQTAANAIVEQKRRKSMLPIQVTPLGNDMQELYAVPIEIPSTSKAYSADVEERNINAGEPDVGFTVAIQTDSDRTCIKEEVIEETQLYLSVLEEEETSLEPEQVLPSKKAIHVLQNDCTLPIVNCIQDNNNNNNNFNDVENNDINDNDERKKFKSVACSPFVFDDNSNPVFQYPGRDAAKMTFDGRSRASPFNKITKITCIIM